MVPYSGSEFFVGIYNSDETWCSLERERERERERLDFLRINTQLLSKHILCYLVVLKFLPPAAVLFGVEQVVLIFPNFLMETCYLIVLCSLHTILTS
jgi:hypothetical protein